MYMFEMRHKRAYLSHLNMYRKSLYKNWQANIIDVTYLKFKLVSKKIGWGDLLTLYLLNLKLQKFMLIFASAKVHTKMGWDKTDKLESVSLNVSSVLY